jgi:hypothetical protein
LLDVLRTRRALPPGEAKGMLTPLAGAFDELGGAGLSCPDIAVHEILLSGGNLAAPKFLPLTTGGSRTLAPDATMVASSFSMMGSSAASTSASTRSRKPSPPNRPGLLPVRV